MNRKLIVTFLLSIFVSNIALAQEERPRRESFIDRCVRSIQLMVWGGPSNIQPDLERVWLSHPLLKKGEGPVLIKKLSDIYSQLQSKQQRMNFRRTLIESPVFSWVASAAISSFSWDIQQLRNIFGSTHPEYALFGEIAKLDPQANSGVIENSRAIENYNRWASRAINDSGTRIEVSIMGNGVIIPDERLLVFSHSALGIFRFARSTNSHFISSAYAVTGYELMTAHQENALRWLAETYFEMKDLAEVQRHPSSRRYRVRPFEVERDSRPKKQNPIDVESWKDDIIEAFRNMWIGLPDNPKGRADMGHTLAQMESAKVEPATFYRYIDTLLGSDMSNLQGLIPQQVSNLFQSYKEMQNRIANIAHFNGHAERSLKDFIEHSNPLRTNRALVWKVNALVDKHGAILYLGSGEPSSLKIPMANSIELWVGWNILGQKWDYDIAAINGAPEPPLKAIEILIKNGIQEGFHPKAFKKELPDPRLN